MIDFMNKPMETTVGDNPPQVPPEQDELADMVRCIVRAADGRKAENIVALRVSKVSSVTSFLVICFFPILSFVTIVLHRASILICLVLMLFLFRFIPCSAFLSSTILRR